MKIVIRLLPTALALALAVPSSAADATRIVSAKRALERGVYAKTPETLIKARAEFEAMSAAEPKSAARRYHSRAWAKSGLNVMMPRRFNTAGS